MSMFIKILAIRRYPSFADFIHIQLTNIVKIFTETFFHIRSTRLSNQAQQISVHRCKDYNHEADLLGVRLLSKQ